MQQPRLTLGEVEDLISQAQYQPLDQAANRANPDVHIIITAISRGWVEAAKSLPLDARWNCLR
jgi:hypothetical protein